MAAAALIAASTAATSACGGLASALGRPSGHRQPITIAFGGDVHFEGVLRSRLDASPATALDPAATAGLRGADLSMVNLETAVTDGGSPAAKQFTFRAPATAFDALRGAGIDVVTMANNHGMDYGEAGLRDSVAAAKKAGMPVVGIGLNAAQAYAPWRTTIRGTKVAVIGATQVLDDNLIQEWTATDAKAGLASAKNAPRLVQEVRAARKSADVVIVYLHWGQELNGCPLPVQKDLARQLAGAGADVVVGGHAHVLEAGGFLKGTGSAGRPGTYVAYGLGNFFFYNAAGRTAQSGVLRLTVDPTARNKDPKAAPVVKGPEWSPAEISDGVPRPLQGPAATQSVAAWKALRSCADVADSAT